MTVSSRTRRATNRSSSRITTTSKKSNIHALADSLRDVPITNPLASSTTTSTSITLLPTRLTPKNTALSRSALTHLHTTQRRLRTEPPTVPSAAPLIAHALAATLVFAGVDEDAGTAVCIGRSGLLLTCAHCISSSTHKADALGTEHWLLFASGRAVRALCVAWDFKRDVALLAIISAQGEEPGARALCSARPVSDFSFPCVRMGHVRTDETDTPLVCIGHPGSSDLESSKEGLPTGYDVLHVSEGYLHGYATDGPDAEDMSVMGSLMHSCWTYWGHSGAPVVERDTGSLVGVHSSWDERTGMRRGVPVDVILAFLYDCGMRRGEDLHGEWERGLLED